MPREQNQLASERGPTPIAAAFGVYLAQALGCPAVALHLPDRAQVWVEVGADPDLPWRIARGDGPLAVRGQADAAIRDRAGVGMWHVDAGTPAELESAIGQRADALRQAQLALVVSNGPAPDAEDGLVGPASRSTLLEQVLARHGLEPTFVGAPVLEAGGTSQPRVLAIVEPSSTPEPPPPPEFRVLAIVPAFNEADVIDRTLAYLIGNGLEVYLLDNWSTDATPELARSWLGRGLLGIERFPPGGPDDRYDLRRLLGRVEELAANLPASWYVLHDADERRDSPWPDLSLHQAFWRVDQRGFTCIDHVTLTFWPTTSAPFDPGVEIEAQLPYFEFSTHLGHFHQRRGWKNTGQRVALAASAGHDVQFAGRRVEPFKFLQRHYPIRSQAHGEQKVLRERLPRFAAAERAAGWHAQYDEQLGRSFVRDPNDLQRFDPRTFFQRYLVHRLSGLGVFQQPPDWATAMLQGPPTA